MMANPVIDRCTYLFPPLLITVLTHRARFRRLAAIRNLLIDLGQALEHAVHDTLYKSIPTSGSILAVRALFDQGFVTQEG